MSRTRATTTGTSDTSHSTAHRDAHTPGGADALWAGDGELARSLAVEAGEVLMQIRRGGFTGDGLKAAGDAGSQAVLARRLDDDRPDDAVLSEEAPDDPARLTASRVWIIDPLDGTREFSEPGRIDWAVHVALWAGGDLVAGAVAMPADGICYCTASPPEPPVREPGPLRLAVSRTRPPAFVAELATRLGAVLVPMGSAGVKFASVWRGETDAYVHAGGQFEWDSAAPVAVARAAGLHTSRIDGSPLVYNQADPRLPDLVVCRPELADTIVSATAALAQG